jgi:hypothetical protein
LIVKPIRNDNTPTTALVYNTTTSEVSYSTSGTKTFVIDHPTDGEKYLVHACLEGPEAGVYYRGNGEITNNNSTTISLPHYVDKVSGNFTVQINGIYSGKIKTYNSSKVVDGKFTVYGENGEFFWTVYGERQKINVEPLKKDVTVKGNGPYRWL